MATLWLIGMMGSGKTTIAPLVAARAKSEWFDTDREVERATGSSVPDLMAAGGAVFREAEGAAVAALAGRRAVVACGGGVVTNPEAVSSMRASGVVVLLEVPIEVLESRLGDGKGRPLLAEGVAPALRRIAADRARLYRDAADAVVDATGSADDVAEQVLETWTRSS